MIKSLTVTNHLDESITIVLGDSDTSGFLITKIEGLGPCKATINSTEMATGDGSIFNSSRLEPRNIVISMVFDYRQPLEMEEIRHKSYKYFPIKKKVKLTFETGGVRRLQSDGTVHYEPRVCSIEGYIESNEPNIFSPREGTQISIMCPDPYFYSDGTNDFQITNFGGMESMFSFPFGSTVEPSIAFSRINITNSGNVVYTGDSEVGMVMYIEILADTGDITISDADENTVMTIRSDKVEAITGKPLSRDDVIIVSTVRNKKFIRLNRGGFQYNILNSIDRNASWFVLYPGNNTFAYNTATGQIAFRIENRTLYEGV